MAFVTGFAIRSNVLAVDRFCQDPGAGSFPNSTWTTKKKCMRQLIISDRILQGGGYMRLAYHRFKGLWPVFSR